MEGLFGGLTMPRNSNFGELLDVNWSDRWINKLNILGTNYLGSEDERAALMNKKDVNLANISWRDLELSEKFLLHIWRYLTVRS